MAAEVSLSRVVGEGSQVVKRSIAGAEYLRLFPIEFHEALFSRLGMSPVLSKLRRVADWVGAELDYDAIDFLVTQIVDLKENRKENKTKKTWFIGLTSSGVCDASESEIWERLLCLPYDELDERELDMLGTTIGHPSLSGNGQCNFECDSDSDEFCHSSSGASSPDASAAVSPAVQDDWSALADDMLGNCEKGKQSSSVATTLALAMSDYLPVSPVEFQGGHITAALVKRLVESFALQDVFFTLRERSAQEYDGIDILHKLVGYCYLSWFKPRLRETIAAVLGATPKFGKLMSVYFVAYLLDCVEGLPAVAVKKKSDGYAHASLHDNVEGLNPLTVLCRQSVGFSVCVGAEADGEAKPEYVPGASPALWDNSHSLAVVQLQNELFYQTGWHKPNRSDEIFKAAWASLIPPGMLVSLNPKLKPEDLPVKLYCGTVDFKQVEVVRGRQEYMAVSVLDCVALYVVPRHLRLEIGGVRLGSGVSESLVLVPPLGTVRVTTGAPIGSGFKLRVVRYASSYGDVLDRLRVSEVRGGASSRFVRSESEAFVHYMPGTDGVRGLSLGSRLVQESVSSGVLSRVFSVKGGPLETLSNLPSYDAVLEAGDLHGSSVKIGKGIELLTDGARIAVAVGRCASCVSYIPPKLGATCFVVVSAVEDAYAYDCWDESVASEMSPDIREI